jgi:acyl carrier protein
LVQGSALASTAYRRAIHDRFPALSFVNNPQVEDGDLDRGIFAFSRIACDVGRWTNRTPSSAKVPNLANKVDNIEAEIVEVLAARLPAGVQVSAQTQIARDLGLDSVAVMDFVMDIEDHFDISIPLDRIAEVETVADLSKAVEALLKDAK